MSETKHSWTEQELRIVCVCYKQKLPIDLALLLTNTTNTKSMEMRYQNCLFLEKGRVEGSLSHASKSLVKAWHDINEYTTNETPIDNYIFVTMIICMIIQIITLILN